MADKKVVLLSSWASAFSLRVQIALAEMEVDYEFKEENLFDKSPLLLELNPVYKKIPVLIHNGNPVCESSIIIQYIDEIYQCGSRIWSNKGDAQAAATEELIGILKQLEGELIVLVPFSLWFHTYETFGGFSIEKECPKLMAWVRRCNEKDSVSKVLPDPHKVYERTCGLKKRLGLE